MSEPTATNDPETPHAAVSEHAFLEQQAREARAALAATLAEAKTALLEGVDPITWARRYPVVAVGGALVAGFAAAVVAVPSKEQQEIKKLERLARALRPAVAPVAAAATAASTADGNAQPTAKSIWSTIIHETLALLRPMLVGLLTSYMGKAPSHDGAASGSPDPADTARAE